MAEFAMFERTAKVLKAFETKYNASSRGDLTIFSVEVQRDELKAIWARVKETFDALPEPGEGASEELKHRMRMAEITYNDCYTAYLVCAASLGEFAHNYTAATAQSSPIPTREPRYEMPARAIHLPPCDTEVFYGDYLSWPSFRDMFTAIYITNSRLTSVEKLFHLNQKTQGEAREIVRKSPLTNEGFVQAWQNLSDRYENKRILVNSQLKVLFNLPSANNESGMGLKQLQREINNCISALQLHGVDVRSWDAIFVYLCSTRLPETTLALWEQTLQDKTAIPQWAELDKFLTSRFQTLETVSDLRGQPIRSSANRASLRTSDTPSRRVVAHHASTSTPNRPSCPLCNAEPHHLRSCSTFQGMSKNERWAAARRIKVCYNCLANNHARNDCKSRFACSICQGRHHTLLHPDGQNGATESPRAPNTPNMPATPSSSSADTTPTSSISCAHVSSMQGESSTIIEAKHRQILLGTALVHLHHQGSVFPVRALIDSGSEGTFVTERVARRLNLPTVRGTTQVTGLNKVVSAITPRACNLTIRSQRASSVTIEATALVLPQLTGNLPTTPLDPRLFTNLPDLPLADDLFYKSDQVDVLLGSDILPQIMLEGVRRHVLGSLIAQETIFGWILSGPVSSPETRPTTIVALYNEVALDRQLTRFWELEEVPKAAAFTPDEQFCEELFKRTTRRNPDGRYVVALPFRPDFPTLEYLGQSRQSALQQFSRNEASLLRKPSLKEQYDSVVREYLALGHMKKVETPRYLAHPEHFYLPHHAVIKPDSVTTRVRVVFNASCPTSTKKSLNDVLFPGPALQLDLTVLIVKWRMFKVVFNADIEKMYRQILVDSKHTPFQRILFREAPTDDITDYELKTVTFGVNCAPYLAIRTLHQLADDTQEQFPLAADILRNFMYVDDALAGAHDVGTAIRARDELTKALASAGFPLRKWTSNVKRVLEDIPKEHRLKEDFLDLEESSEAKTLGIRWNARLDQFFFVTKPLESKEAYTKREVLASIAKLFDPAGWLAPIVVVAKMLMQQIWMEKIGWDDNLGDSTRQRWQQFVNNYRCIDRIKLPRWVGFVPNGIVSLHGFCDASEKAYAAAVYLRVETDGCVQTHLLMAKTKVAPLKTISLPRLELSGAVLLAEVISVLVPLIEEARGSVHLWTDSTIVLAWLRKTPCSWTTFVANRVSKIVEKVGNQVWRHVVSQDNPADLGSRGMTPNELLQSPLWWHGPAWLRLEESQWPAADLVADTNLEGKRTQIACVAIPDDDILGRFSDLTRAVKVLAYVFRFFHRTQPQLKGQHRYDSLRIASEERTAVETRMIVMSQRRHFAQELSRLDHKETIDRRSSLVGLNPFVDQHGLMRVGGRLAFAPSLTYDERHPIILAYSCTYARLLVRRVHLVSVHGGNQLVLRLLRQKYWIVRCKNLIKTTIHGCKVCVVNRQQQRTQIMAALPPARTSLSRPFAATGVDFAGPFDIKNYTGRACLITKGYVCVFVCFATRAIHLEAVSDLSTAAFLAAFSRFVARRGCPTDVYSDNGTNFVGASKELKRDFRAVMDSVQDKVSTETFPHNIHWHFNPAGAPHMGGLWEAGVKSFKMHFRRIAGIMKYTFEEFATLLSRIEACLNSRPISAMSDSSEDLEPLTPGHFLVGSPLLAQTEPEIQANAVSIVNRWQKLKALHQQFCQRWKTEYLNELHKRGKWKYPTANLAVGQLVVLRDENLPPNEWRLGRITRVVEGKDGKVRVADVRTGRGTITRPITKLVLLPS